MRTVWLIALILISPEVALCSGEFKVMGGRAAGMCGVSVTLADFWSAANNQAASAWDDGFRCGVFFENRYLVKELSYKALSVSVGKRPGTFGLNCSQFGDFVYSETKAGFSYARKFGKHISAGLQLSYFHLHVADGYGSRDLVNCEAGFLYHSGRHWIAGLHIVNPVPVKLNQEGELLPVLVRLGLSYIFSVGFFLSAEIEKDLVNRPVIRAGAEYSFARILSVRLGIASSPFRYGFGAGILLGRFSLDLASEYSQYLGFSPSVSLQYLIKKQDRKNKQNTDL